MMRFEIHPTFDDQWRSRIRSLNGELTWGTETYVQHQSAEAAIVTLVEDLAVEFSLPASKRVTYFQASKPARDGDPVQYERKYINLDTPGHSDG